MRPAFTTKPRAEDMVTEPCTTRNCVDMLCVACEWEGHAKEAEAPWVIFQTHTCKNRKEG